MWAVILRLFLPLSERPCSKLSGGRPRSLEATWSPLVRSLSSSSALDAVMRNLLLVRPGNCPPPRKDTNLHVKVKFRHRLATKERSPTIPVLREGGCRVRRPRNRRWDLSHLKLRWELRAGRVQPVPDQRREAAAVPYRIEGAFPADVGSGEEGSRPGLAVVHQLVS